MAHNALAVKGTNLGNMYVLGTFNVISEYTHRGLLKSKLLVNRCKTKGSVTTNIHVINAMDMSMPYKHMWMFVLYRESIHLYIWEYLQFHPLVTSNLPAQYQLSILYIQQSVSPLSGRLLQQGSAGVWSPLGAYRERGSCTWWVTKGNNIKHTTSGKQGNDNWSAVVPKLWQKVPETMDSAFYSMGIWD